MTSGLLISKVLLNTKRSQKITGNVKTLPMQTELVDWLINIFETQKIDKTKSNI